MTDTPAACYVPTSDTGPHGGCVFESTSLAAAEWYPDGQHGGVVAALMARAVEHSPSLVDMEVARITVELFRVVPVTQLEVVVGVIREGKRIQTSEVRLYDGATELARALVQRLRTTTLDLPQGVASADRLEPQLDVAPVSFREIMPLFPKRSVSFGQTAVEVREVEGSFGRAGPASVWFRFTHPLVAGESMSPTQRAVVAGDFSNGLSRLADSSEWVFMNSDLAVNLIRPPRGEWVALVGSSDWEASGRGVASSRLYDIDGPIGRATQTLYLDRAADHA